MRAGTFWFRASSEIKAGSEVLNSMVRPGAQLQLRAQVQSHSWRHDISQVFLCLWISSGMEWPFAQLWPLPCSHVKVKRGRDRGHQAACPLVPGELLGN